MTPGPGDPTEPEASGGPERRRPARSALAAAAAVLALVGAVALARTTAAPDDDALPAVGTYDLSGLPERDRSATTAGGLRVVVEVVLVTPDEVRLGMSWTGTGDSPTTWGCDGASAPAGPWWATPAGPDGPGAWSPQTGALCRTVDDVSVLDLEPGGSAADFHRFPRDATWASGRVRVVGWSPDRAVTDPGDAGRPDVDLVVDLTSLAPEPVGADAVERG